MNWNDMKGDLLEKLWEKRGKKKKENERELDKFS